MRKEIVVTLCIIAALVIVFIAFMGGREYELDKIEYEKNKIDTVYWTQDTLRVGLFWEVQDSTRARVAVDLLPINDTTTIEWAKKCIIVLPASTDTGGS